MVRPRAGVDAGDHPPITPVGAASRAQAVACGGFDGWRLYELVGRTFLATLSPDARLSCRTVSLCVGGEVFTARSLEVADEG
eukprot:5217060-Prymnesium_polylepis.1